MRQQNGIMEWWNIGLIEEKDVINLFFFLLPCHSPIIPIFHHSLLLHSSILPAFHHSPLLHSSLIPSFPSSRLSSSLPARVESSIFDEARASDRDDSVHTVQ